ncbi:hypothetical protein Tco_0000860 [Tanacetum coccineum]
MWWCASGGAVVVVVVMVMRMAAGGDDNEGVDDDDDDMMTRVDKANGREKNCYEKERDRGEFVEMAKVAPHGYMRLCSHGPCVVITFGDLAKQVPKSYNTLCKNRPWWYKLGTLAALALVV